MLLKATRNGRLTFLGNLKLENSIGWAKDFMYVNLANKFGQEVCKAFAPVSNLFINMTSAEQMRDKHQASMKASMKASAKCRAKHCDIFFLDAVKRRRGTFWSENCYYLKFMDAVC